MLHLLDEVLDSVEVHQFPGRLGQFGVTEQQDEAVVTGAALPGFLSAGDTALERSDGASGLGRDRDRAELDVEGIAVVEPFYRRAPRALHRSG